jgi:enterochelin esterase-like enzyme
MKNVSLLFASVLLLPGFQGRAAGVAQAKEAPTNAPPRHARAALVSPEVHPDRTVTFRLEAADAQHVAVSGEWSTHATDLVRDDPGVWSATVGPLEPNIYDYSFVVDGVAMGDPHNMWAKPMRFPHSSELEIPGTPARLWEYQRVPHGTVHEHVYFSKSLSARRRLHVYTPPGYEKNSGKYPVLYLLHGMGDNDATWSASGCANFIEDNLLARREAKPMIIVMPDGHPVEASAYDTSAMPSNLEAFEKDLLQDVIPLVESTYRVKANRDNRAIIGLSMGGGQSLTLGLMHRDVFAWVGGMSSYVPDADELAAAAFPRPKSNLKLLWFACGKDDQLLEQSRKLDAALARERIPHTFSETAGRHSWPVWRNDLGVFLPMLFERH